VTAIVSVGGRAAIHHALSGPGEPMAWTAGRVSRDLPRGRGAASARPYHALAQPGIRAGRPALRFACAYLATPYARRMTGQTLCVDGGVNIMA
jgi:NAD(P)-dependent dehydrogenase (short-subunit alcohol dehydrogenase family)